MILTLTRRHTQLFFRDRMTVFLAFLSPLILFLLYTFFLGAQQVDTIHQHLPYASRSDIHVFVNTWLWAGIIMITTLTTGLVTLGVFVNDQSSHRFRDFLVAPINRTQMILSYLFAAFAVSTLASTILFIVSQVDIVLTGGSMLAWRQGLEAYAVILLLCLSFSAISSFFITFIKSTGAFSACNTLVGVAIGFIIGGYIMADSLSKPVLNVMNVLPFAQGAALLRRPFTTHSLQLFTAGHPAVLTSMQRNFSIKLAVAGHSIQPGLTVGLLIAFTILFAALGSWRIGEKVSPGT